MQRHHYVPQFYLRNWYAPDKGEFWLYCRDGAGQIVSKRRTAGAVGYHRGLYSTIPEFLWAQHPVTNEIEEKFFSPLDSAACDVHRKLLSSGPQGLSVEERFIWSLFVNSILERSPSRVDEVREDATEIAKGGITELWERLGRSNAGGRESFLAQIDLVALTNNAVLSGMVKWICNHETIQRFFGMEWSVIRVPQGKDHLLTSDSPVVVNGVSAGTPIYMLSLALSPSALLVMHIKDEAFDEDFIRTIAVMHSALIVRQTKRYLISSRELLDDGNIKYRKMLQEFFSCV